MPKDPAVLFYFDHWRGGTMTMTRHLKGCYIDLLDAQFNQGHLSLEEIRIVLGNDFAVWGSLSKKFAVDEAGKYFNERLQLEQEKRKKFIGHQSENGKKGGRPKKKTRGLNLGKPKKKPLVNVDININEDLIKDRGVGEGFFLNEITMQDLTKVEINAIRSFILAACQKKITDDDVGRYWEAFRINNSKNHEWYGSHEKLLIHFRHSLKNELNKKSNGTTQSTSGKGAGLSGNAVIRSDKTFTGAL